MFDIEYFREDPTAFYDLSRNLLPSNFKPTPMHHFIKLLEVKGLLLRCYTQNIDTLERQAGVSPEKLVEAHGSFGSAHCTGCDTPFTQEYFMNGVVNMVDGATDSNGNRIPWCKCNVCGGCVKPDIVFFGEGLPRKYFALREEDLLAADLLIVAGTSLSVAPFAHTMHFCNPIAPRLLINNELVGQPHWTNGDIGFLFNQPHNYNDAAFLGTCDEGVMILARLVGWEDELKKMILMDNPLWVSPLSDGVLLTADERIYKNYRNSTSLILENENSKEGEFSTLS